jgi:hypothetical protein
MLLHFNLFKQFLELKEQLSVGHWNFCTLEVFITDCGKYVDCLLAL